MHTKRLFIGIPLPITLTNELVNFQNLHKDLNSLRWVPINNFHITIYFIGEYPIEHIPNLRKSLLKISTSSTSFDMNTEGYCIAPERNPYMVWVRFSINESFSQLANDIGKLFNAKKIHPLPHATIARYKPNKIKPILKSVSINKAFTVNSFFLYESVLKPSGAQYKIVEKFILRN